MSRSVGDRRRGSMDVHSSGTDILVMQSITRCCPPDTALGMTIDVDFTKGSVNSFVSSGGGAVSYGTDGATFTVAKSGDAPQLSSVFYIMFGRVEFTMKSAPGAGIVSSLVMLSDALDEIDMEWLGADGTEVQTNYFGKGQTTTYNRGQFNPAANNQGDFITYTIDWTADQIVWSVGGTVVRTLAAADAETGQYPQTPMQVRFGAWAGGDPATNAPGTVQWARGPTNYADGPFSMVVKSIVVADYSTGKQYVYGDQSGTWQSIQAVDGKVGANEGTGEHTVTATATAAANTALSPSVPAGGIGAGAGAGAGGNAGADTSATETGWPWVPTATSASGGTIPDGWVMTSSGKIVPASSNSIKPPHLSIITAQLCGCLFFGVALFWR
ncbi:glycoside hydrolase family 16 [Niveomyces insectorum RCEF 264]|uniref:chitinase n=1 Tax=Niveomyces insectorum RCEF 264 TaxID=1081102 RepID=A0A167MTL6_9HYPO|nr:glycoside hydrolase family 16 [Niveomyces insectorum RCEF 264]